MVTVFVFRYSLSASCPVGVKDRAFKSMLSKFAFPNKIPPILSRIPSLMSQDKFAPTDDFGLLQIINIKYEYETNMEKSLVVSEKQWT